MPTEAFTEWEPRTQATRQMLRDSLAVLGEYAQMGYSITIRQLYYQLVSRDLIANNMQAYKRLINLMTNAREGGWADWNAIVDRGRTPVKPADWTGAGEILDTAATQFRLDRWAGQEHHVEVWCEKDALSSVIEPTCARYHVRFMANRGYSSSTAMYDAAKRMEAAVNRNQWPVVIYLGDHDPSGMDMTRDVEERLRMMSPEITFAGLGIEVIRLALNYVQVQQYRPPANPAKLTDSRIVDYLTRYGRESWELDALDPQVLDTLIATEIERFLDRDKYDRVMGQEESIKKQIRTFANNHNGCVCKNPYCVRRQ